MHCAGNEVCPSAGVHALTNLVCTVKGLDCTLVICPVQGKVRVRYMDWNNDLQRLHRAASQPKPGATASNGKGLDDREDEAMPPALAAQATFDVILGSDILYEVCREPLNPKA